MIQVKKINSLQLKRSASLLMVLCMALIQFTSCKKYLDKKSDSSLVVPQTLEDLQGILNNNEAMNINTPGFGESSAGDCFVRPEVFNSFDDFGRKVYTWSVDKYTFPNDWAFSYSAIYNSNYCLENVVNIERTVQNHDKWDNVIGSALFFRGYYFLNLIWEYGKAYDESTSQTDLGIVIRLHTDFNVPSVRSNVKDSYMQAINDLESASRYLDENPQHVMNPSKAACYGALARAFLSMRLYDSAYKYADLCLQIKNNIKDYNDNDIASGNTPFKPFNEEIIFYSSQSQNYSVKSPIFGSIDTVLYSMYDNNDRRKTVFFRLFNGYQRFKGNYTASNNVLFSGLACDEMLLTRSECLARSGDISNAMKDLNDLVAKRWKSGTFVPLTAANQLDALEIILKERRKELVMRGLRWIDIKRLNKEKANIILKRVINNEEFQLEPNEKRYALPLPFEIITLTGIQQN